MAKRTTIPRIPEPIPVAGGERTGSQTGPVQGRSGAVSGGGLGVPLAVIGRNPSDIPRSYNGSNPIAYSSTDRPADPPAPDGDYDTYRWIRADPTVAIARAVTFGPIQASDWSFTRREPSVPQEWVDFATFVFKPIQATIKRQLLYALDFGWRGFEQVFGVFNFVNRPRITLAKLKPLRPENCEILIDDATGAYAGIRNGKVDLEPEATLRFTYDNEDDNWYGRSRHENIRETAWWPWMCRMNTLAKIGRKVSNVIPIVEGPISAEETTAEGKVIRGYDAALTVLQAVNNADGVMVEKMIDSINEIIANPELAKLTKWNIRALDTGSAGTSISGIIESLKYYDQLKMRGWLRPERTATEGQHGTKAEVAEQADVGLADGEEVHQLMCQTVSKYSLNRLLIWNFGEAAADAVTITPSPLIDEKKALYRWIMEALLANPSIIDFLVTRLDIDAMADNLGVPTLDSVNPTEEEMAALKPEPIPPGDPGPVPGGEPPQPGE